MKSDCSRNGRKHQFAAAVPQCSIAVRCGCFRWEFALHSRGWALAAEKGRSAPARNCHMEKRFCPQCGSKLETRCLENRDRGFCPACRVVHYENPVPATAIVAFNEGNELLLVRRAVDPGQGQVVPAGRFPGVGRDPRAVRPARAQGGDGTRWPGAGADRAGNGIQSLGAGCAGRRLPRPAGGGELRLETTPLRGIFRWSGCPSWRSRATPDHREGRRSPAGAVGFRDLPGGAYVVTSGDHLGIAREACRGNARIVQYREKESPAARRLEMARGICGFAGKAAHCSSSTTSSISPS